MSFVHPPQPTGAAPPPPQAVLDNKLANEKLADLDLPDNYVAHTLRNQTARAPVTWKNWWSELNHLFAAVLVLVPIASIYGACTVELQWKTAVWAVAYYFFTGLGITAGYHRLWAHRSYNASKPLQYVLALAGAGAVEGSIKWWTRGHRAHHRYTDTDLDPYNAHKGFFYSHIGWMLLKPRRKGGISDVSDLSKNEVVRWQNEHFTALLLIMGFVVPTLVAGLGWGDWAGGYFYAGMARLCFVHHSTFCVNSLAHWLGEATFDDKHTPRDHMITALMTIGEGYHNFHHQFPMDYRNAIKAYQYDPTKWMIWTLSQFGLASHLKTFPDNEVQKGKLTMQLKRLRKAQDGLQWAADNSDLPVVDWATFQAQSATRPLILIAGFIHDVTDFVNDHPGGRRLVVKYIGRDATTAFFGGVYDHSNAAHNLLSMKRVGVLHGGHPHALDDRHIPPSQRLRISRYNGIGPYASSALSEDDDDLLP